MWLLDIIKVIILGIVEGITEWLPVSSTGHMILVDEFLQLNQQPYPREYCTLEKSFYRHHELFGESSTCLYS